MEFFTNQIYTKYLQSQYFGNNLNIYSKFMDKKLKINLQNFFADLKVTESSANK